MTRGQRRRGYTLVEVTLVLALMVIIGAVTYPNIEAAYGGIKVEGASDSVRAAWSEAQAHAVNEGRPYRFDVIPGKGNYRVVPAAATDKPVLVATLPRGIVFPNPDGSVSPAGNEDTALPDEAVGQGQWVTAAVFLPDGTAEDGQGAQEDVDVRLQLDGVRPMVVHLRALTGVVTVERGD